MNLTYKIFTLQTDTNLFKMNMLDMMVALIVRKYLIYVFAKVKVQMIGLCKGKMKLLFLLIFEQRMKVLFYIKMNLRFQINKTNLFKDKDPRVIILKLTVFNKTNLYFRIRIYSLKFKNLKVTLKKKKNQINRISYQLKIINNIN